MVLQRLPIKETGGQCGTEWATAHGRPPWEIKIAQIVRHNPAMSSNEIADKVKLTTGNSISPRTIRQTLTNMKYGSKKLFLLKMCPLNLKVD